MAELRCNDGTVVQISAETEIELRKAFEPPHIWKHGDVFGDGNGEFPKIYIKVCNSKPQIFHLSGKGDAMQTHSPAEAYINWPTATFLFNIREKL